MNPAPQLDHGMRACPLVVRQRMLDVDTRQGVGQQGARFGVGRRGAATSATEALSQSCAALASASLNSPRCASENFAEDGAKRRASSRRSIAPGDLGVVLRDGRVVLGETGFVAAHQRVQRADVVGKGLAEGRRRSSADES